ncbi:MAG: divergent polysaccharide deacetylase family protein [Proteobacteria bacterium]|nr:divergent polysaccharide deacetylase family protein [Pseudomonadota bacterium]
MICWRYLAGIVTLLSAGLAMAQATPRIAIIIDDLGYQFAAGQRALNLPGPVSYAILPDTPSGTLLARAAHELGKEVLLHLPLEAVGHEGPDEPCGITLDMSREAFHAAFDAALASVPYAIGVSSHRGSLLTRHPGHMRWLMQELSERNDLFFIDCYTTAASVALQIAAEFGVAATRRHVFLDHDRSPEAMTREFEKLTQLAGRQGIAIGIGHPHPETLSFLEVRLAELDVSKVKLIPVSEALNSVEPGQAHEL